MKNNVPERVIIRVKDMVQGNYTDEQITEYIDEVITWLKRNGVNGNRISLGYTNGMIGLIARGVEDIGRSGGLSWRFKIKSMKFVGDC